MMREAIQEGRRHFGVAEDARPFAEGEIGGDDDRGALVEPVDQMKQHLAAGLSERQIAKLVEDDEVHAGEAVGQPPLSAGAGDGEMRLAGAGSSDQDGVTLLGQEGAGGKIAGQVPVDRRFGKGEAAEILGERQYGGLVVTITAAFSARSPW